MAVGRTMLIHQAAHWQQKLDSAAETSRWPMAAKSATHICNHVPKIENGLTTHKMWTRTKEPMRKSHNLHVHGCPVCVLQKEIADGKKTPQWKNRSTRGMCMGASDKHSGDVPLVLNPRTGKITPQWNVMFDNWFSTIAIEEDNLPDFHSEEWSKMFGMHTHAIPNEDEDAEDFEPVRKLRWREQSTDEDQHQHISEVRNVQESPESISSTVSAKTSTSACTSGTTGASESCTNQVADKCQCPLEAAVLQPTIHASRLLPWAHV